MYKRKRIVIALGGNALGNTLPEQMQAVKTTARALCDLIEEGHQAYEHPDLLLFSVIELASSTCYNCILYQQPVPLEEYMPYLHKSIDGILSSYQKDSSDTSAD